MGLQMRRATPADIHAMCDVYFDSFSSHLVAARVFPQTSQASQVFWFKSLSAEIQDPRAHFFVVTDPASSNPDWVIAFAKWVQPETETSHQDYVAPPDQPWPTDGDTVLADEFFGALAQKHEEHMAGQPHWYLELIGVSQQYQGKGAARQLVTWGVDRADRDGVDAYLDASPMAAPIYRRYGFEDIETLDFAGGAHSEVFMRRKPRGKDTD